MTVENLEIKVKATGVTPAANKLTSLAEAMDKVESAAGSISGSTGTKAAKSIEKVGKAAEKSNKGLGNFLSSLKRIAFYRVIRGIIKSITQAFSEGLEWAYQFSDGIVTEGHRFAEALDHMKMKANTMKAQLGSVFISLLAVIAPILETIIMWITKVADAISQFFAAFTGGTYLKAQDIFAKWSDDMNKGAKAAKEWKNQLLGFDEINRLNEPSDRGSGTAGIDPSLLFKDTDIDDVFKRLAELFKSGDFSAIGEWISDGIKQAFEWAGEKLDTLDISGFLAQVFTGAAEFIRGLDIDGIVESLTDFVCKGIENIDLEKVLGAWIYFSMSLYSKLPGIILESIAGTFKITGSFFRLLGLDSIANWFDGIAEKIRNCKTWIKENWIDPFLNAVKELLGIHSPSTAFKEIGVEIVQGLWDGINEKWKKFREFFEGLWKSLKEWWDGLSLGQIHIPVPHFEWTYEEATGLLADAMRFVGLPATIPHLNIRWYANGGFPEQGSLFFAGERGPELVGTMGGQTAVSNQEQIVEGIRQGVYDAVMAANNSGDNDVQVRVYLDSREIKAGQQRINRAWGV